MSDERHCEGRATAAEVHQPYRESAMLYEEIAGLFSRTEGVASTPGNSPVPKLNFSHSESGSKTLSKLGFPDITIEESSAAPRPSKPWTLDLTKTYPVDAMPGMKFLLASSDERANIRIGGSELAVKCDRTSISATDKNGQEVFKIDFDERNLCKISKLTPEGAKLLNSLKIPAKEGNTFRGTFRIDAEKMTFTSNPGSRYAKEVTLDSAGKRIETSQATGLQRHFDSAGKLEATYMRTSRSMERVKESNVKTEVIPRGGVERTTVRMDDGRTVTRTIGLAGNTERQREIDKNGKVLFDYNHKRDFPNALQKCMDGGMNGRRAEYVLHALKREEAFALARELDRLEGKTSAESAADAKREKSMSEPQKRQVRHEATEALKSLNGIAAGDPLPFVSPEQRAALRAEIRRIHRF